MRDDSSLYSGMTSVSFASVKTNPVIEKAKEDKKEKKVKLSDASQIIVDFFDKEITNLQNIDYLKIEEMLTDEHFKAEMMARKKTVEKLKDIRGRISRIMESK